MLEFKPRRDLKNHAEQFIDAFIEPSTAATYRAGIYCILRFLKMSRMCLAFINVDILGYFVTHCQLIFKKKSRYETIKTYLSGVGFFYPEDC